MAAPVQDTLAVLSLYGSHTGFARIVESEVEEALVGSLLEYVYGGRSLNVRIRHVAPPVVG